MAGAGPASQPENHLLPAGFLPLGDFGVPGRDLPLFPPPGQDSPHPQPPPPRIQGLRCRDDDDLDNEECFGSAWGHPWSFLGVPPALGRSSADVLPAPLSKLTPGFGPPWLRPLHLCVPWSVLKTGRLRGGLRVTSSFQKVVLHHCLPDAGSPTPPASAQPGKRAPR